MIVSDRAGAAPSKQAGDSAPGPRGVTLPPVVARVLPPAADLVAATYGSYRFRAWGSSDTRTGVKSC